MANVFAITFDHRLLFPPLTRPRRILECGYGTASWLDINPTMQPEEIPENLFLQVDDLNRRFYALILALARETEAECRLTFPASNFDLGSYPRLHSLDGWREVHSQLMCSGIHVNRWTDHLRDIFRVLRGGGWSQMVEVYYNVQSDNGSLTPGTLSQVGETECLLISNCSEHALSQWSARYLESMEGLKDLRVPLRLSNMMRAAGFVDVESRMIQLPTCAWSTGSHPHPTISIA
ncbi:Methyltransferase laeA [Hyphodiscus hymeniophilus]|uniref:Methyltransferase laeA n=1 Tax=Hyphodiscus hymeniophilus TaxID=353542 RepID=A0A9P6VJX2_9HELO|nr:Methyltransferase laeA [Hyphodiscus hymeniophilus]